MILIATDEAGYGPKLGPFVVAATMWRIPDEAVDKPSQGDCFAHIRKPTQMGKLRITVDDSKNVFRPKSAATKSDAGYRKLELVTLAGCRWCGIGVDQVHLASQLASKDCEAISQVPWLEVFSDSVVESADAEPLRLVWENGPVNLLGISTRVVTAKQFNAHCDQGQNKSDILSNATLGLVRDLIDALPPSSEAIRSGEAIDVYCDRHGGRRYYAGPLQKHFKDTLVQVVDESKHDSAYRVPFGERPFAIRFTVKGDSFTPVAFSSMVAKYLREKSMESLNKYFASHSKDALKPTAGYPVDADRYLKDIQPVIRAKEIDLATLVRCR